MVYPELIDQVKEFTKKHLTNTEGGHDRWHSYRVWKIAGKISSSYSGCNKKVIELSAWLHDLADEKLFPNIEKQDKLIKTFLESIDCSKNEIGMIISIIHNISYKDSYDNSPPSGIEYKIVQDADRLDALGAIGIARAFNYGGTLGRALYNPDIPPKNIKSKKEYIQSNSPTLNHFFEKLLLLKDQMHTPEAKELATQRHIFMKKYVDQFLMEWEQ